MFDLIISNSLLLDGTGAPARQCDIGVTGECVVEIGNLANAKARERIDAAGLVTAPGFIDAHSHSDTFVLAHPEATSKITQGVTTEICGQCGSSAAPLFGGATLPSDWEAVGHPGAWQTVAQYRAVLESARPAVNIALFAGHNTLRKGVMGYDARPATRDETALMARRLEAALDEGAAGLSTGLLYNPGPHAAPEEIETLARVAAGRGALYATHMRSEGAKLLEALDEVLRLADATGVRVQISHLKTAGRENAWKLAPALEAIHAAQARGIRLHADRYPYLAGGTDLDVILPEWAAVGGREKILERLDDPAQRARVIAELAARGDTRPPCAQMEGVPNSCLEGERPASRVLDYWSDIMIGGTWHPSLLATRGKTLDVVAREWGLPPAECAVEIIRLDQTRTGAFFGGMNQPNLETIFREPWVMPGSDASLRALEGPLSLDHPHPRAFGTFPRYLRMVTRMEKPLSLPEAVRRMTSLPADAFGLRGRGRVEAGAFADLVVFDPEKFLDRADYANPHQMSEGVCHVVVNGALTWSNKRFTGLRRGVFLD